MPPLTDAPDPSTGQESGDGAACLHFAFCTLHVVFFMLHFAFSFLRERERETEKGGGGGGGEREKER